MGLRDTIIAGQIAELDRIRLEGKSAVDSAYREWQVMRQQYIKELENLDAVITKHNEKIQNAICSCNDCTVTFGGILCR